MENLLFFTFLLNISWISDSTLAEITILRKANGNELFGNKLEKIGENLEKSRFITKILIFALDLAKNAKYYSFIHGYNGGFIERSPEFNKILNSFIKPSGTK